MPQWIYNRPPERCNETELRLAKLLNDQLPEEWLVRWGYWYEDNSDTLREGDFLILGPGGILVVEVKTSIHQQVGTGRWDGEEGDNPISQLLAQHAAVLRRLRAVASKRDIPWVSKVLALPTVEIDPAISDFRSIPRSLLLAANDLKRFSTAWCNLFKTRDADFQSHRQLFVEAFGEGINPKQVKALISETDRLILRQTTADYRLLDMLSGNQQLVVEGSVGTGKSWYAVEQARRYAENAKGASGRNVLVVVYNLALCERVRANVGKLKPGRGSITVRSSEELAAEVLQTVGIQHQPPTSKEEAGLYFGEVLPQLAIEALASPASGAEALRGRFEALVVDEAQDHDTCVGSDDGAGCGWWSLYTMMLRDGWSSPISIFGDQAQRPPFRHATRFNWNAIKLRMSQHAHVRLHSSLRYTRQMLSFLRGLDGDGTQGLVGALQTDQRLLDGPEVFQTSCEAGAIASAVSNVLEDWRQSGLCQPSRALVLYDRSSIEQSVLSGVNKLCGQELRPYMETLDSGREGQIGHCSIHKAKGLDALGVVMVGMKPFDQLTRSQDRYTYFMGASRARQLLACVHLAGDS